MVCVAAHTVLLLLLLVARTLTFQFTWHRGPWRAPKVQELVGIGQVVGLASVNVATEGSASEKYSIPEKKPHVLVAVARI